MNTGQGKCSAPSLQLSKWFEIQEVELALESNVHRTGLASASGFSVSARCLDQLWVLPNKRDFGSAPLPPDCLPGVTSTGNEVSHRNVLLGFPSATPMREG